MDHYNIRCLQDANVLQRGPTCNPTLALQSSASMRATDGLLTAAVEGAGTAGTEAGAWTTAEDLGRWKATITVQYWGRESQPGLQAGSLTGVPFPRYLISRFFPRRSSEDFWIPAPVVCTVGLQRLAKLKAESRLRWPQYTSDVLPGNFSASRGRSPFREFCPVPFRYLENFSNPARTSSPSGFIKP
jgi:hypothetical protein